MTNSSTNRSEKKVLMFVVYCAAIVLGVYMTFFYDMTEEKETLEAHEEVVTGEKVESMRESIDVDYSGKELPDAENESADEMYKEGALDITIYFSNTEKLDNGNMPLEAQAVLTKEVQRFLNLNGYGDVTELYISDESYEENQETIIFSCYMDGYQDMLQIEFSFIESCLKYYILPNAANTEEIYE